MQLHLHDNGDAEERANSQDTACEMTALRMTTGGFVVKCRQMEGFLVVEVTSGEASVVFGRGLFAHGPAALTHSPAAAAFVSLFAGALFMKWRG